MVLNPQIIVLGTGCTTANASLWLNSLNDACAKYGITSEQTLAAFLANVGVESDGLTAVVENLNYSAQGLANNWPNRYAADPSADTKTPNALALKLNRNPQAIANNCYASRNGNGDESSGDGWKFRGHGLIQLTGRSNFQAFKNDSGLDVINNPDLLLTPGPAAMSAAWYFASHGCIALAKAGDFDGTVKAINGAPPRPSNKGDLRRSLYQASLKALYSL